MLTESGVEPRLTHSCIDFTLCVFLKVGYKGLKVWVLLMLLFQVVVLDQVLETGNLHVF